MIEAEVAALVRLVKDTISQLERDVVKADWEGWQRGVAEGRAQAFEEIRLVAGGARAPARPYVAAAAEARPVAQKRRGVPKGWFKSLPPAERLRRINNIRVKTHGLAPLSELPAGK